MKTKTQPAVLVCLESLLLAPVRESIKGHFPGRTVTAGNPEEAISRLEAGGIGLLVMEPPADMMTNAGILQRIDKACSTGRIPVMLIAGEVSEDERMEEFFSKSLADVISPLLPASLLLRKIGHALEMGRREGEMDARDDRLKAAEAEVDRLKREIGTLKQDFDNTLQARTRELHAELENQLVMKQELLRNTAQLSKKYIEQQLLNNLCQITEFQEIDLDRFFSNAVRIIPRSFTDNGRVAVKITWGKKVYRSELQFESTWRMSAVIPIDQESHMEFSVAFDPASCTPEPMIHESDKHFFALLARLFNSCLIKHREDLERRNARQNLLNIIETSPLSIVILNSSGNFIFANETAVRGMRYSKEELVGKHMDIIIHPEELPRLTDNMKQRLAGKAMPRNYTTRIILPPGNVRIIEIFPVSITWENKPALMVMINDITDRIKAENALRVQYKIDSLLGIAGGLQNTLEEILGLVMQVENIDCGTIYLARDGEDLQLACHQNHSPEFVDRFRDISRGTALYKTLALGKSYLKPVDLTTDQVMERNVFRKEGLTYVIIVPLINEDRHLIGSLNLGSRSAGKLDEETTHFLESVAIKISSIIQYGISQEKLNEAYRNLEQKVHERTAELEQINIRLSEEIEFHKATKEALRVSEAKYRAIFENAQDGIILHDLENMKAVEMNPVAYESLGYSAEEAMNLNVHDFWIVDSEEERMETIGKILAKPKGSFIGRHRTKSGELRYRNMTTSIFCTGDKKYLLVMSHDLTELKKTEEALRKSEAGLRFAQKLARLGTFEYNVREDKGILSHEAREIFGIEDDSKITWEYALSHMLRADDRARFEKTRPDENFRFAPAEYTITQPSGESRDILLTTDPVFDADGQLEAYQGTVQDITELKRMEERARQSEKQYEELQNNLPVGIWRSTFLGEFKYVNDTVVNILGYDSPEDMYARRTVDMYYHENDRPPILREMIEKGELRNKEFLARKKNGTPFWASMNIRTINDEKGNIVYFDGTLEDISLRKKMEEDLKKANQAIIKMNLELGKKIRRELKKQQAQQQLLLQKSKLESLGELAAGIAHEINQPLGIISLSLENISLSIGSGQVNEAYIENKLPGVFDNIRRIQGIIDHIRIFSRDQKSVLFERLDVNEAIRGAVSMIGAQYRNHNVRLVLDLKTDAGFTLGNVYKLEQVILNLLSNAKYAVDKKEKETRTTGYGKEIVIRTYHEEGRIVMEITDNGTGIPRKNLDRIFNPFFTTKEEGVGTGLGLSITYGIINEMKGDIVIQSKVGEFTTARVALPCFASETDKS
jgi:PAS domain S-box-containing protein